MSIKLSVEECKVMWVVGALERLATIGLIGPNIPLKLTSDAIEQYLEIDDYRDYLFNDDKEIELIFRGVVMDVCDPEVQSDEIQPIIELLLKFKNNRTEIVKYGLAHQFT